MPGARHDTSSQMPNRDQFGLPDRGGFEGEGDGRVARPGPVDADLHRTTGTSGVTVPHDADRRPGRSTSLPAQPIPAEVLKPAFPPEPTTVNRAPADSARRAVGGRAYRTRLEITKPG